MSISGNASRIARLIVVGALVAALIGALVPISGRAQEATPTATASGDLAGLLQLAPDVLTGTDQAPVQIAAYADIAAQTAVSGLPVPSSIDDPNFAAWAYALIPLLVPDPLFSYAMVADWHSLLGFDLWEIEQSLQVGEPPEFFTLMRGRFDETDVRAAWTSQGYRMLDVNGIEVASLHEDASFDISSDLGRFAFARFNNAAILPDGTLVYSPALDGMRTLIAIARGTTPSLGDRVDVAAMVGAIEKPLASATLLLGTAFNGVAMLGPDFVSGTPEVPDLATRVAEFAEMPPILMALLGVTPGGPLSQPSSETATPQPDIPPAQFEIALLLPSHDAAVTAARVATERLATQRSLATSQPLTDYFASWDARVLPNRPVAVLELNFAPGIQPRLWVEVIFRRDMSFLAW